MAMYCSEYQYSKFFHANQKKTTLINITSANTIAIATYVLMEESHYTTCVLFNLENTFRYFSLIPTTLKH